jgi:hypothetical protein
VLLNPAKLNRLLTAVSDAMETDPKLDLLDFATRYGDAARNVRFATIPTTGTPTIRDDQGNRVSIVAVDTVALPAFFAQLDGTPSAYTDATAADPADVSVRVVNGTGTAGLGSSTASALRKLGFAVAGTSNSSSTTTLTTVTYPAGKEEQAKAVAQRVPGATVAESSSVQQVTLTLGTDGHQVASPTASSGAASASKAPASSSPAAAPSSGAAKSYTSATCIN